MLPKSIQKAKKIRVRFLDLIRCGPWTFFVCNGAFPEMKNDDFTQAFLYILSNGSKFHFTPRMRCETPIWTICSSNLSPKCPPKSSKNHSRIWCGFKPLFLSLWEHFWAPKWAPKIAIFDTFSLHGRMAPSRTPPGALCDAQWALLAPWGAILTSFEAILGPLGRHFGAFGVHFGRFGNHFGVIWPHFGFIWPLPY